MKRALEKTVNYFRDLGSVVVIVKDVPTLPERIEELPKGFTQQVSAVETEQAFMGSFEKYYKNSDIEFLSLSNIFCAAGVCSTYLNGSYLYSDNNHISAAGAALTIPLIQDSLKKLNE
jgi:lysophospholipase L1-like esterase